MNLCKVECDEATEGVYRLRIGGVAGPDAAAELSALGLKGVEGGKRRMVIDLGGAESIYMPR